MAGEPKRERLERDEVKAIMVEGSHPCGHPRQVHGTFVMPCAACYPSPHYCIQLPPIWISPLRAAKVATKRASRVADVIAKISKGQFVYGRPDNPDAPRGKMVAVSQRVTLWLEEPEFP